MQKAKEQGDFLLVGLHIDDDVMERRGAHLPIMDLHERSLSVLACRYVNEVIIGNLTHPPSRCIPQMPAVMSMITCHPELQALAVQVRGSMAWQSMMTR